MNKFKLTLLIIAIISIVLFFSIYAFILQKKTNETIAPEVYSTLILPYSKAIAAKDYETAYKLYTCEKYKNKHKFDDYLKAQKANSEYFGQLDSMNLTSGVFVFLKDLERKWVYRGTINYYTNKTDTKFSVDVVKENGKFKISRTYPSQMTIRASAPMIF